MILALVFLVVAAIAEAAEIRGQVIDASTSEPIARVAIRNLNNSERFEADPQGRFVLNASGRIELLISSVGYRPYRVTLDADSATSIEIKLVPDTLRTRESIDVSAGPFGVEPTNSLSLAGGELRNLASVLADDPLRALQGLPGVNANDDFQAQLSLRGAGFNRIGIYVDGVLLHSPYHTLQADPTSASLSVISSDLLESAVLHSSSLPVAFADRTAAAADLRLRDGDRKKLTGRGAVSASNASMSLEGPLGRSEKGSWLVSARKSYLQYIINQTSDEPGLAFAFSDVQGRLAYDLTPKHTVRLSLIHGTSGLDRSGAARIVGINTYFDTDYDFTIANASSRWSPVSTLVLQNNAAWMREVYENRNRDQARLAAGGYGEWIYNSDNLWQWHETASLNFGVSIRRLRDDGALDRRLTAAPFVLPIDAWRGTAVRAGAHVMQQGTLFHGRLQLRAGTRFDHHDAARSTAVSPQASATLSVAQRTNLHLNWGINTQYPELSLLFSRLGRTTLTPERAIHYNAAIEQRLDDRTRVRVDAYQRLDRDLLFRPLQEPRILNQRIYGGNLAAPYANSIRGYARGIQFFVQRRTTNGVTGWMSYSYSNSRLRDGVAVVVFPSDFDQRHTLNFYASYRLRPTVNFSGRWVYGSGFPVRGFYAGNTASNTVLSSQRNLLRLPEYHRLDLRANKTFVRKGWHITLFAEVVNAYNRGNARFDDVRGIDGRTGAVRLGFEKLFPILPSAGLAVEF